MLDVTVFMQSECESALAAAADLLFSPDISIYERRISMPIRPIIRLGDPRLRQRSAEIEDFDTPGLQEHLAACPRCRARADDSRSAMREVESGSASLMGDPTRLEPPPVAKLPLRIGKYKISLAIGWA